MHCLICREAQLVPNVVSVGLRRGEIMITVNNVPALVCPKCKDAVVDSQVAKELLRAGEKLRAEGLIEATQDFHEL